MLSTEKFHDGCSTPHTSPLWDNIVNEKHQTQERYLPIVVRYDGFIRATSDTIIDEVKCVQVEDLKKDKDDIKFEYIDNIVDLRKYYLKCI